MSHDDRGAVRACALALLEILDDVGDDVGRAEGDIATVMKELLAVDWLDDIDASPVKADPNNPVQTGWLYHDCDLRIVRGRFHAGFAQEPHNHGAWNIFAVYRGAVQYRSYRRRDDGSTPYRADLEVAEDRVMTDGEVSVLPSPPHDIHAVAGLAPYTSTLLVHRGTFSPVRRQYLPASGVYRELPAAEAAR
jgi:predicted metal-dependent enzyme (double-stranded beta helix superfamily)